VSKLIYLTTFLLLTANSWAQSAGTTGADILEVPIGVRATALAGAYSALGDDVYVIGYNPAGLARISQYSIGLDHIESYAGVEVESLSVAIPTKDYGIFGGQLVWRHMPDIANTLATDPTISANDVLFTIADAQQFGKVSIGGSLKIIYSNLGPEQALTEAVDLGFKVELLDTDFAAAVQNIGPSVQFQPGSQSSDPLPLTFRLGAARPLIVSPASTLLASAEVFSVSDEGLQEAFGLEYWHRSIIAIRLGYRFSDAQDLQGGLTAGAALRYNLGKLEYELGFAWQPNSISSTFVTNTYTFGLLFWF
jgi:hypothetical protein